MDPELVLLPAPQRRRMTGARLALAPGVAPPVKTVIERGAVGHAEGYRLAIDAGGVEIVAEDEAGARHAAMTLRQIARQASGGLPGLVIEDWPDFRRRGVMLDVSRDRVPTMATLYALVDLLAEWKLNELQLYTEHTFAYRDHEEVWRDASPFTAEEIVALDRYCAERGIELVPNQNSFGHLERWLKLPRYRPLAEAPDGFMDPFGRRRPGPFSLCPIDPRSLEFLSGLYDELLPQFKSRYFNVGCDETFDLGQGRSRAACEERGKGVVYLEFLTAIAGRVAQHGRTMMFWGDIILNHPELIPALPPGAIALEWGYEADHPFGAETAKFAAAGIPYYVCPGTSSWNSIAGRTANAIGNLQSAAESGRTNGALGYLVTDWGDNGHWQPLPVSYLGFAGGAAQAWAGAANRDLDLARALDRHVFLDAAGVMGATASDLGNVYLAAPRMRNGSALAQLLLAPEDSVTEGAFAELTIAGLERAQDAVQAAIRPLARARMARPDAALVAAELAHAAALLGFACRLGKARLEAKYEGEQEPVASARSRGPPAARSPTSSRGSSPSIAGSGRRGAAPAASPTRPAVSSASAIFCGRHEYFAPARRGAGARGTFRRGHDGEHGVRHDRLRRQFGAVPLGTPRGSGRSRNLLHHPIGIGRGAPPDRGAGGASGTRAAGRGWLGGGGIPRSLCDRLLLRLRAARSRNRRSPALRRGPGHDARRRPRGWRAAPTARMGGPSVRARGAHGPRRPGARGAPARGIGPHGSGWDRLGRIFAARPQRNRSAYRHRRQLRACGSDRTRDERAGG